MTNIYINEVEQRKQKETLKQEIVFGQVTGLIILIASFLHFLSTTNEIEEFIMKLLMITGASFFVAGVIFPYLLYYPSKWLKEIMKKVFQLLLACVLIIIYGVLVIPVGKIHRRKWEAEYSFLSWNTKEKKEKQIFVNGFKKKKHKKETDKIWEKKNNKLKNIIYMIGYFVERKQFVLIPILCVLIILGFLSFFGTSSIVTPMIYTIF